MTDKTEAAGGVAAHDVTDRLPKLLDAKALQAELGVTRAAAEAIMRCVPTVQIDGLRKTYVRREDVAGYLDERTFAKDQVPVTTRMIRSTQQDGPAARATPRARHQEVES